LGWMGVGHHLVYPLLGGRMRCLVGSIPTPFFPSEQNQERPMASRTHTHKTGRKKIKCEHFGCQKPARGTCANCGKYVCPAHLDNDDMCKVCDVSDDDLGEDLLTCDVCGKDFEACQCAETLLGFD